MGDEATSEFISLEAGKAYYIEILNKEGGGGDNVAVAWTTGDAIVPDALPISGDYLSPWVPVVEGPVDISAAGDAVVPSHRTIILLESMPALRSITTRQRST